MTDDKIKKYFLGELSETEAEGFEENCAQSAELTEQTQLVESELIDAYLREELSAADKKLFESNYLITETRLEKLKFAKAFLNNFKTQTIIEPKVSLWQSLFSSLQLRLAFAGIISLLLLGGFIFVLLNLQKSGEIVQQQNTSQTPTPKIENQNNQPVLNSANQNLNTNLALPNRNVQNNANTNKPTPPPEIKPTPTPETVESAPALASFVLVPGTLRSEGEQFIKIPSKTAKVTLSLNLPKDAGKYQTYKATIQTADGDTIFTASNLKTLNLTLSADKLENRTYIIFVEGTNAQNSPETIAEYTFKVRR